MGQATIQFQHEAARYNTPPQPRTPTTRRFFLRSKRPPSTLRSGARGRTKFLKGEFGDMIVLLMMRNVPEGKIKSRLQSTEVRGFPEE